MLKFITKKTYHVSAERQKVQKELFAFARTASHGFPHNPTALAWDPTQQLFALGTKNGSLRVLGAPGAEWIAYHSQETAVTQVHFVPRVGRLVTVTDDNVFHLWEINNNTLVDATASTLDCVKSLSDEGLQNVFVCSVHSSGCRVLVGTEKGDVAVISLNDGAFQLLENATLKHDKLLANVPEDYKIHPGGVECIAENPKNASQFLVGFQRGVIVLIEVDSVEQGEFRVLKTFVAKKDLTSLSWHRSADKFSSAHSDGGHKTWSVAIESKPLQQDDPVYGPYPCKLIEKLVVRSSKLQGEMTIFSGGMPRSLYGDKHTVSVHAKASAAASKVKKMVFDFTSRVIDFFVMDDSRNGDEYDNPHTLIVLLEQEIVAIDLENEEWPQLQVPYLASLHQSAITCVQHVSDVSQKIVKAITEAAEATTKNAAPSRLSNRAWPIDGGIIHKAEEKPSSVEVSDILVTGHEDGSVRLWDASRVTLCHLVTLKTAPLFTEQSDASLMSGGDEDDDDGTSTFLPFHKMGSFDPFSDDPRFAVKKLAFNGATGTLAVGGTAGQVVVFSLDGSKTKVETQVTGEVATTGGADESKQSEQEQDTVKTEREQNFGIVTLNVVGDRDGFTWKGCEPLTPIDNIPHQAGAYNASCLVQMKPPAGITALALNPSWDMLAVGTAHGFGVADISQHKAIVTKCTLNANDVAASGDTMSRRKSFKKSLRESFRRLRRGRSQRSGGKATPDAGEAKRPTAASRRSGAASATADDAEARPVERQVEARSSDDAMSSMVRTVRLTQSYVMNSGATSRTLWAGTNSGVVFAYIITTPTDDSTPTATLCKEIRLKHRAPVIAIHIIDAHGFPIESEEGNSPPDSVSPHWRLILCSEEQLKVFTLPTLKPVVKVKITAHEGSRLRRATPATFRNVSGQRVEHCLCTLTNHGEVAVWSMPELRRQLFVADCVRHDDINGISSLVFTKHGEGFYLNSASEFDRFSVCVSRVTAPHCTLQLPDGARPVAEVKAPTPQPPPAPNNDVIVEEETTTGEEVSGVGEGGDDSGVSSSAVVVAKEESESTLRSVSSDGAQVTEESEKSSSVQVTATAENKKTTEEEKKTEDGATTVVVTTTTTKKVVQQQQHKKQKKSKKSSKVVVTSVSNEVTNGDGDATAATQQEDDATTLPAATTTNGATE